MKDLEMEVAGSNVKLERTKGLTGHWKTWIPWVRTEEFEESRDSPGNLKDLMDLFANPTTWGRPPETLRIKLILSLSLSLSVFCNVQVSNKQHNTTHQTRWLFVTSQFEAKVVSIRCRFTV